MAIYTSLKRIQAGALQDKNSFVLRLQLIKCLLMPSQEVKIHNLFPFSCMHPVSSILDGKLPTYLALTVVLWVKLNVFGRRRGGQLPSRKTRTNWSSFGVPPRAGGRGRATKLWPGRPRSVGLPPAGTGGPRQASEAASHRCSSRSGTSPGP